MTEQPEHGQRCLVLYGEKWLKSTFIESDSIRENWWPDHFSIDEDQGSCPLTLPSSSEWEPLDK